MTEEPLSQSEKNHWDKLAELLGVKPASESQSSPADAAQGERPASPQTAQTSQESSNTVVSQVGNQVPPKETPIVPDSIPLRRSWVTKPRSAGNWDEVMGQLGLAPVGASPPAVGPSVAPSNVSADAALVSREAKQEEALPEPAAVGETRPLFAPVEQTIVPPALEEASLVALATPEEERPIVQEEVTPPGDWLEEQVVAGGEGMKEAGEVWPVTHDILDIKDSQEAVAADTLLVTDVPQLSQEKELAEGEGKRGEKKGRKRHRRKKKARTPPVNPEPFEEELPEIVELATTAEENGTTAESPSTQAVSTATGQEETARSKADRKKRRRPSHEVAEDAAEADTEGTAEDDEGAEISRPSHKAIPGWAEVVGYVIEKNLAARARRPNHRERRR